MTQQQIDDQYREFYKGQEVQPLHDGIINEKLFYKTNPKANPKILWILKEPYDLGDGKGGWNYRNDINSNSDTYLKYKTWRKIAQVSSGIINDFSFKEATESYELLIKAIKSIAVVNVSKLPANTTSTGRWSYFEKTYEETKHILLEQIKTIKPDIIIGGNILYLFNKDLDLNGKSLKPLTPWGREVYKVNDKIFINAYHPSFTGSDEDYFNDIVNVIKMNRTVKN